jgi:imidazolonepropionase-like amidohydrolase
MKRSGSLPAPARPGVARRLLAAAAALLAPAAPVAAQPTAFTDATVHTASGPVLERATVVVENGRIVAVGADVVAPAGARLVDCSGKHLWPGFVAPLTALGLTEIGSVRGTNDHTETGIVNPNIRAEVQINPESELLPVARHNGVTAALVAPLGGAVTGTSAIVHLDGWTHEDMTLRAPVALHVQWPAMSTERAWWETRSEEEQKKDREKRLREIRDAFEDARAYWKARAAEGKAGVPRHDQDVKWDAMGKALRGEIPVVFRAAGLNQIEAVLKFVDEQRLENVVLVDAYDAWRVIDELKARDVAVVTGAPMSLPRRSYEPYDFGMTLPAKLHQAGVRFCISDGGGSGNAANVRSLPYEAAYAAAYGLPRAEALKAVTLYPAQIFGVGDRIGSIEPGKVADLVIGTGDPLEVTTVVEQVYVAGRPVSMENRQTRLFQKYDARPRGPKARPRATQSAMD